MIITIKFQTVQEVGTFSCTSNQFLNKTSGISFPAYLAAWPSLRTSRRPLTMCSRTGSVLKSGFFMSWQKLCKTQQPTTIDGTVLTLKFTKLKMRSSREMESGVREIQHKFCWFRIRVRNSWFRITIEKIILVRCWFHVQVTLVVKKMYWWVSLHLKSWA